LRHSWQGSGVGIAPAEVHNKLRGLGLLYRDMTFSGAVDESQVDDIRRRVEATGGGMLTT